MRKILPILLFSTLTTISWAQDADNEVIYEDNKELAEIYRNDQVDRKSENINWIVVTANDNLRKFRVYEMLDSNLVHTSTDYNHAAMVFQHGGDSTSYGMAVKLMRKSIELDSTANKWLLAAAIDRYLLSNDKPQIYGTQYIKYGSDGPWEMQRLDSTVISDAERKEYKVETLAEQRERVKSMNSKKLSEIYSSEKGIDDLIAFMKSDDSAKSKYDLSENGIVNFAYSLMKSGENEEALKVFELSTELFPEKYNTYDSYAECLMVMGQKELSLKAYRKSLELNPQNKNAQAILEKYR